jgi:hypothetical protein
MGELFMGERSKRFQPLPPPFVPSVSRDICATLSSTSLDFARDKRVGVQFLEQDA